MIRYDMTFTGRVQGVGFRYTTLHVARSHRVTGWVRNEADGSVKCVAEGEQAELDRFVAAVKQAMNGCIENMELRTRPATSEFKDFIVRH